MGRKCENSVVDMLLKKVALFLLIFAMAFTAAGIISRASEDTYTVSVSEGYLALRTAKAFDASNEIG